MIHKDALITSVTRNKFNELVYKIKVKQEDYTTQDYEALHAVWQEGMTMDVGVTQSSVNTPAVDVQTYEVNRNTGEITQ